MSRRCRLTPLTCPVSIAGSAHYQEAPMHKAILTLVLLPALSALPALAQPPQGAPAGPGGQVGRGAQPPVEIDQTPPVEDFKPSTLNQQGRQYPEVNSQRRVRTRLVAPQAQSVLFDIGGVRYRSEERRVGKERRSGRP